MHKIFFFVFFLCAAHSAVAQNGKIYYDDSWQVTKKRNADWYRLYTLQDSIYKIEDHYIDGPIYMTGSRTNIKSNSCNYRVGPIVFYDPEGNKLREGQYKNGLRTGTWRYYYRNSGILKSEFHYSTDTGEHLDYTLTFDSITHQLTHKAAYLSKKTLNWDYTANDSLYSEISYADSGGTHTSTTRYKDHTVTRTEKFGDKKSPTVKCYNDKGDLVICDTTHPIFTYVEQMPKASFDMPNYLAQNLVYPKEARNENIEGRVIIKFTVDEDGAVSTPKVVKTIGGGCDEEALRAVSEMPYWQPGTQNGVPVRVYFTLPIVFKLK